MSARPRCRKCRRPLRDELSRARECGPCCWLERLTDAEREEITAALPREFQPQRLSLPRIPFPRRRKPDPEIQPALFDLADIPQTEDPAELEQVR